MKCKAIFETSNERIHNIRRAKIDAYILDNYSINFDSDDLLFGRLSENIDLTEEDKELINSAKQSIRLSADECGALSAQTGHRVVDFEKILKVGLKGILAEIDAQICKIDYSDADSTEKEAVYKSMKISLEAVCRYAERTRCRLLEAAENETDDTIKNRYLSMAKNFISTEKGKKAVADFVRVAGYSDYFVNLSETIQNEIINRTENGTA